MTTLCGALRSDGAPCEDEQGHYGGHIWPDVPLGMVRAGDTMRFSVELLRQMVDDFPRTVLVRVKEIHLEADGAKKLILERAPDTPHG